jgi:hypothetical protein
MAFRDEREAQRFQLEVLDREVAERTKQLEEVSTQLRDLEAEIAQEVQLKHGKPWAAMAVPLVVVVAVFGGIFFLGMGAGARSDAEVVFGDVTIATGTPPAPVGAACTTFVSPVTGEDATWNTDIEVLCDGKLVYGGESLGGVDCEKIYDRAVHCEDTGYTSNGGDPKLLFDRRGNRIVLEDRAPTWRLEIVMAPAPMEL